MVSGWRQDGVRIVVWCYDGVRMLLVSCPPRRLPTALKTTPTTSRLTAHIRVAVMVFQSNGYGVRE
jgi:hypothetical protein